MFILYLVGAICFFSFGRGTVERPTVVLMEQGWVVQSQKMNSPILVINDGVTVEIREARPPSDSLTMDQKIFPFHKDSFGDWTVDCSSDCKEDSYAN